MCIIIDNISIYIVVSLPFCVLLVVSAGYLALAYCQLWKSEHFDMIISAHHKIIMVSDCDQLLYDCGSHPWPLANFLAVITVVLLFVNHLDDDLFLLIRSSWSQRL